MNDGQSRHPEAHTMAAFVDGTLAPSELTTVATHLRDCADCRVVVTETARFEREEEALATSRPSRSRLWWSAAAAGVAAAMIAIPLLHQTPMQRLIAAAPKEHRRVEARLSGFPYARLQAPSRGNAITDPADLKLNGAAGEVLEKTSSGHAAGVAYLLTGQLSESLTALERAANDSKDAKVWSDLAATRDVFAMREDAHKSELPQALADANHALRIDAKSPEAIFNRALILEHLGITDQARKEWQHYLEIDPGSGWANEAREHLRKLEDHSERFDPRMLEAMDAALLVRRYPYEARASAEVTMLGEWAADPTDARLARVQQIANALAAFNDEHLLADAVAAAQTTDSRQRAALIEAHRLYFQARVAYNHRRGTESEQPFLRAAELFERGRSPMASVARYYAAQAALDQNRATEVHDVLTRLLAQIDRKRHRALAANIEWELALAANISGDWGMAVREAGSAAAAFTALGERGNAATADQIGAHALDRMGEHDLAWQRRVRALASLDAGHRIADLWGSATVLRSLQKNDAAIALLDLVIDDAREGSAVLLALAHADRALLAGDSMDGRQSIAEARMIANRIKDPMQRETTSVQIDLASAAIRTVAAPREAAAEADRAVDFITQQKLDSLLPDAYLRRARALRAVGDEHGAAATYALALDEVEKQRDRIGDSNLSATFLDTAAEIVEDSIDLQLALHAPRAAFAIADRAKGSAGDVPSIANGSVLLQYSLLPHAVAIVCVTNHSVVAEKINVDRGEIVEHIHAFTSDIRRRAPIADIEREGAVLHRLLIDPVRAHLAGISDLVVIPDRELNTIPFAALYDDVRERFLVEEFTIRIAPNAVPAIKVADESLQPALVVADPTTALEARLPESRREAIAIAAMYKARPLMGEEATRAQFASAAENAALIHYAGHADSNTNESFGALLLAPSGEDSGVTSSADIARFAFARHPVVVLAACGTFRGDPAHVTGMSSIARAFLGAGARAVAGTLWEIDDDVAAEFFRRFHERLRSGAHPARALRETQLDMLKDSKERLRQPATWAPIELLSHI